MQYIIKDLIALPFTDKIQDKIQAYYDYFVVIERMRKNLYIQSKLCEVKEDLEYCKSKGFKSEELLQFASKLNMIQNWYTQTENILNTKKTFNIKQLLHKYEDIAVQLLQESYLDE